MKLNYINNSDSNVQDKMRYFADYFSFANEYLGKLPDVPFDNQLSLIEKAIFQIENNFAYCSLYVINYLTELFNIHNKTIEIENSLLSKIEKLFYEWKGVNDKKDWLKNNPDFLNDLKIAKLNFEETLFDKTFLGLRSYITCPHNLKKHKREIQYGTRLLVSLFRLKGHSKNSLDSYISRIISNDISRFPFPPEILKIKGKDEYVKSTKEFLNTQNFNTQFEGLKNLFIAEHHKIAYFFYVIENCEIDKKIKKDFKVQFQNVTFISTEHNDLKKLRKSIRNLDKKEGERTFPVFFGKDKMLAYLSMGYESKDSKKEEGVRIVAEELLSLNQYFNGTLFVNSNHYLAYDDFESDLWSAKTGFHVKTRVSQFDFEEFKNNPYEVLRAINSPAKDIILECEKTFLKAFARDEVEYYWIFIENIFAPLTNKNEDMRKGFAKILINLIKDLRNELLFNIAMLVSPNTFRSETENSDTQVFFIIQEEILRKKNYDFNIYQYKDKAKSLVMKDLIELHKQFTTAANIEKWKIYFSSLLLDLYAYRNSLVHSGKINEYSKIKLNDVLPKLISRARWTIIKACNKNENLNYSDLINKLTKLK